MLSKTQNPNYDGANVEWADRHVRSTRAAFGQVVYEPGGYCGPRHQKDIELVLIHQGSCEVLVDGRSSNLQPGIAYLFLPRHHEEFRFSTECRTHHSWCSLRPDLPDAGLCRSLAKTRRDMPASALFTRLLADAFMIGPIQNKADERVVEGLALALCAEYLAMTRSAPGMGGTDPCVSRAVHHMEEHYSRPDCLATSHLAAGCSRNALITRFVRVTNLTPDRFLWRLRTQKGIALLCATGLNVSEIAYRCGFQSPFHFSRLVKTIHGCSPKEARARAWTGDGSLRQRNK